jgi:hypothetical protein
MVAFHDQPAMRQKRTFLFVNKDSTSKSLSNSKFDDIKLSEINRHVQKARERRLRKRIKIASSTYRLVGFKKVDSSDESSPDHSLSPSSDTVLASSTISTATAAKPSSDISGTSIDITRSTKDDDDEVDGENFQSLPIITAAPILTAPQLLRSTRTLARSLASTVTSRAFSSISLRSGCHPPTISQLTAKSRVSLQCGQTMATSRSLS